jgi:hypothetical protein
MLVWKYSSLVYSLLFLVLFCFPIDLGAMDSKVFSEIKEPNKEQINYESTEPLRMAMCYFKIGTTPTAIYFRNTALAYILRCKSILEYENLTDHELYTLLCGYLGEIYYYHSDFTKARNYFSKWHRTKKENQYNEISLYNTIALNYANLGDLDSSNLFFDLAITSVNKHEGKPEIGYIYGNMAKNFLESGNYEKAIELYKLDVFHSKNEGNYLSAGCALINIAQLFSERNKWQFMRGYIAEIDQLFKMSIENHTCNSYPIKFHELKYEYSQKIGDFKQANLDMAKVIQLKDSLNKVKDIKRLNNLEFQLYAEYTEKQFLKSKNSMNKSKNGLLFIIFILLLATSLVTRYYLYHRKQYKKNLVKSESRQNQVQEELKLTMLKLNQLENVKNVSVVNKKYIQLNESQELNAEFDQSVLLNFRFSTDEDWLLYKNLFNKFYPLYQQRLIQDFPAITDGELRMACLHRLNLKNEQMAEMLCISKDSLRKTNQRLREKLNIKEQAALIDYLFSIPA